MADQVENPIEIFCLYALEDERWVKELEKHLSSLQNKGQIVIRPGSEVKAGLEKHVVLSEYIEQAHIILFFISPDFIASDECNNFGVNLAMQKCKKEQCRIIPINLRPVLWQDEPFAQLKALPVNGRPVVSWNRQEEALFEVAYGIREAIQDIWHHLILHTDIAREHIDSLSSVSGIAKQVASRSERLVIRSKNAQIPDNNHIIYLENTAYQNTSKDGSLLTIQDVLGSWPDVVDFLKQQSLVSAAHLSFFRVLRVEDSSDYLTIVLQTGRRASYEYLKETNHLMDLTSALMTVFKRSCQIYIADIDMSERI